jgi:hypothetical protein
MKKYFTHDETNQKGPFTAEELKSQGITTRTMIWYDGLEEWTEAGNITELKDVAVPVPPKFPRTNNIEQTLETAKKVLDKDYIDEIENVIPSNKGKKIYKITLLFLAAMGLVSLFYFIYPTTERKERNNPTEFLSLEEINLEKENRYSEYYYDSENNWVLSGRIVNKAELTTYKDVEIKLEYFSQSETSLGTDIITIMEIFRPSSNTKNDFFSRLSGLFSKKIETKPPKNTDMRKTKIELIDAKVVK